MKILNNYIAKQIILPILLVALVLLSIDVFFYFVNELRLIGKGNYDLTKALVFIGLSIPRKIYTIFPWAALIGTLIGLGNLAKNSELLAIRAATVSVYKIAYATLRAGLFLVIIVFIFGEVVSPPLEQLAKKKRSIALSGGQAIQTKDGTWVRDKNNFIYIARIITVEKLENIVKYDLDEKLQLKEIIYAKEANFIDGTWVLKNVQATEIDLKSEKTVTTKKAKLILSKLVDTKFLQTSNVKYLERLSLKNLYHIIKTRIANGLIAVDYERAFWSKIFQPFSILVMILLAVPFVFGPLRSSSTGYKILVGVITGFVFYILNAVFVPLTIVLNVPPIIAAGLPTAIFFGIAFNLIRKI